jgi:hypothetical protein
MSGILAGVFQADLSGAVSAGIKFATPGLAEMEGVVKRVVPAAGFEPATP